MNWTELEREKSYALAHLVEVNGDSVSAEKIRHQADRIVMLQDQVDRLKEIIEKSIDMNNALARL